MTITADNFLRTNQCLNMLHEHESGGVPQTEEEIRDRVGSRACQEGEDWLLAQPSLEEAWANCHRADWMLWLLCRSDVMAEKIRFRVTALDAKEVSVPGTVATDDGPTRVVVYVDPPYRGRSCDYSHEFTREDVLAVARKFAAAGNVAVVSEADPLPLEGARHVRLSGPKGGGATSSRVSAEWLTILNY